MSRRKPARPKGRKFFPVTFTLTQEQIDFLNTQPNASDLVRKLLDDLIESGKGIEEKLGVISLYNQLNQLKEKLEDLYKERDYHFRAHGNLWVFEKNVYKPIETEEAQIAFRVLNNYDEAIQVLKQNIADVKKQILKS